MTMLSIYSQDTAKRKATLVSAAGIQVRPADQRAAPFASQAQGASFLLLKLPINDTVP